MEFFRRKTNIDFLGIRKWTGAISLILVIASLLCVFTKGLNWGLDFTGGYAFEVQYPAPPSLVQIRKQLHQAGISHADVVTFGSTQDVRITLEPKQEMKRQTVDMNRQTEQDKLQQQIQHVLGSKAHIMSVNYTGPEVGKELAQRGMLAMLVAVLATMVYIAMRFEMRFAISSAVALAHDPIIILGIFSFFQIRFDLTALAAVLAVIGYSLNDTVVIYDRVRENFRKLRKASVTEVVNRAVNDTLSRTVMTSGLTLLVVVVLYFWGGPSIHGFSLALIIGVIVGTYSSIYVAGALAVMLGLDRNALVPQPKQVDGRP